LEGAAHSTFPADNGGTFFLECRIGFGNTSGFGSVTSGPYLAMFTYLIWKLKKDQGIDVESRPLPYSWMKGFIGPQYSGTRSRESGDQGFQAIPRYPGTRNIINGLMVLGPPRIK